MAAQMEAEEEEPRADDPALEIEPENAAAVRVFLRMQTQWNTQALVLPKRMLMLHSGLDYQALPVVAAAIKAELDEDLLDRIQFMERIALRFFAKAQSKAR